MPSRVPLFLSGDRELAALYALIAAWALVFVLLLPSAYTGVLSTGAAIALAAATIAGAVVAILGLRQHDNLVVEVTGLCFLLAGPIAYWLLVTVVGVAGVFQGNVDRVHLILYALLPIAGVVRRLRFLIKRRHAVKRDADAEVDA